MKFLKINTNPALMVRDFLSKNKEIDFYSYDLLLRKYLDEYYWPSDSLEKSLTSLYNWECTTIVSLLNNTEKERDIFFSKWSTKYKQIFISNEFYDRLLFQIVYHRPDILYIQEIWQYPKELISKIRFLLKHIVIIGWNCSLNSKYTLSNLMYNDIVYTCLGNLHNDMHNQGIYSLHLHHAFDKKLLKSIKDTTKIYDVVFIGSLKAKYYSNRVNLLKYLLKNNINVTIFGESDDPILKHYCKKPVFGLDLYKVYKASKIVLDAHAIKDVRYSGNIRTYEVTGVGSLLLTDFKEDINIKFVINKELVVYHSNEEALSKIKYYLSNSKEREEIAKAGQVRTFSDYSYLEIAKQVYKSINNFKELNQIDLYNNLLKRQDDENYMFSLKINSFLQKFEELNIIKNNFILYGYGVIGQFLYSKYKDHIKYIIDINHNNINLDNIVNSDNKLILESELIIFISVFGREDEISIELISLGINKQRIKTIKI